MIEKIKKLFAHETIRYLLVGGTNTLFSWVLNYIFSVIVGLGFNLTSIIAFVISSFTSYLLNRYFTFRAADIPIMRTLPRFVLNIAVCYLLAFQVCQPLIHLAIDSLHLPWPEGYITFAKLLVANVIFVVFNYIGQKFFAFRRAKSSEKALPKEEDSLPESE